MDQKASEAPQHVPMDSTICIGNPDMKSHQSLNICPRYPQPYAFRKSSLISPIAQLPPSPPSGVSASHSPSSPTHTRDCSPDTANLRTRRWFSHSESGTEADDEAWRYMKALPAPPLRLRKGLRGSKYDEAEFPMILLDKEVIRLSDLGIPDPGPREPSPEVEHPGQIRSIGVKRRRAEILRRVVETCLVVLAGALVLVVQPTWWTLPKALKFACICHAIVLVAVYTSYPLRLILHSFRQSSHRKAVWERFRLSAAFDPAPYIYPTVLPCIVALSMYPQLSSPLMLNLILGVSSVPRHILSTLGHRDSSGMIHWLLSLLPLIIFEFMTTSFLPSTRDIDFPQARQTYASIYPLHSHLVASLNYCFTTSLLAAELQLLAVALINLLLLSSSPPAQILSAMLWIGGIGLACLSDCVVRWGIDLARLPKWRFRKAERISRDRRALIPNLHHGLSQKASSHRKQRVLDSDADDDVYPSVKLPDPLRSAVPKRDLLGTSPAFSHLECDETMSARKIVDKVAVPRSHHGRRRCNTLPAVPTQSPSRDAVIRRRRKRTKSINAIFFYSLTLSQATIRKWIYAGYLYLIIALLVLIPIRAAVSKYALNGAEPFGWALGYLFGNLHAFRLFVVKNRLDSWISLPPLFLMPDEIMRGTNLGRIARYRDIFGAANTRLGLCIFSAMTVALGILAVLRLPPSVEVDTRRKVFHGTMVAMLLPTIFIDPTFTSLTLAIVLAFFCLLDLLRASQLPPLSRPLTLFLAPYVDGRDNRGPVVISHIFLLIGCAVPLWLSLAITSLSGDVPWRDWDAGTRHVSMMAGVVCVGMGDAAASLIGRRFGRHKWPWSGGKSLQGSLAFALAVFLGLLVSKLWLWFGQWPDQSDLAMTASPSISLPYFMARFFYKSIAAAMAASLMEAVLTGGNDNVVVPIFLWVLVRALRM